MKIVLIRYQSTAGIDGMKNHISKSTEYIIFTPRGVNCRKDLIASHLEIMSREIAHFLKRIRSIYIPFLWKLKGLSRNFYVISPKLNYWTLTSHYYDGKIKILDLMMIGYDYAVAGHKATFSGARPLLRAQGHFSGH